MNMYGVICDGKRWVLRKDRQLCHSAQWLVVPFTGKHTLASSTNDSVNHYLIPLDQLSLNMNYEGLRVDQRTEFYLMLYVQEHLWNTFYGSSVMFSPLPHK